MDLLGVVHACIHIEWGAATCTCMHACIQNEGAATCTCMHVYTECMGVQLHVHACMYTEWGCSYLYMHVYRKMEVQLLVHACMYTEWGCSYLYIHACIQKALQELMLLLSLCKIYHKLRFSIIISFLRLITLERVRSITRIVEVHHVLPLQ